MIREDRNGLSQIVRNMKEETMAYVPADVASRGGALSPTSETARRSLLQRILDALIASQRRRAENEIARYVRARGGNLNDDAEREIERNFLLPPTGNLQAQRRVR